jgi:His-Xaa-Ser system radical SAM maturase HxsB
MARKFQNAEAFSGTPTAYNLLPFRFTRLSPDRELLVNETGEYLFAPTGTVQSLVRHRLAPTTGVYKDLRSKHFLYDDQSSPLLDVLATKYRTKRSFLDGFTKLHIFVTTLRCEHSCVYCQVSRQTSDRTKYDMSAETADGALELMFRSPALSYTLEFQGGEPLLNFDLIRQTTFNAKNLAAKTGKHLGIVITTNLVLATDEILRFCRDECIDISTSLDGPAFIHNANRPRPGANSYEMTIEGIERARGILGYEHVAALMTTTRLSLNHPIEIIDEYVRLGFKSIFLRPISPYGFAIKTQARSRYETDAFLQFYKTGLDYIIRLNREGVDIAETYSKILLTKILTPFPTSFVDLQSPAGACISVAVYNYDGDVYASDEARMLAEMGDRRFRLGNVKTDSYQSMFGGELMRSLVESSIVESIPGCNDCAFQTYCGGDPVFHYATQRDITGHRPSSAFCRRNMEIIRYLFSLLADEDAELCRIFFAWVREKNFAQVAAEIGL